MFGKRNINLHLLLSSLLIYFPCFMYSTPKKIQTTRNFGFLVTFSRNHSPKILLIFFSWVSTCSRLPSCNRVVLQYTSCSSSSRRNVRHDTPSLITGSNV
jgi:hypothetical protein